MKQNKIKTVIILILLCVIIAIVPLLVVKDAEFGGADDAASDVISDVNSGYEVWTEPLIELPSGEVESLLFCLQAAIGAGIIGYTFGVLKERSRKMRKAILVVSFGTSFNETREKTIDAIENDIKNQYPDYKIYRAFTSKMIINKLKAKYNYHVDTVKEAMTRILEDGRLELIVQPTHIINGIENDIMIEEVNEFKNNFISLKIGAPLLTSTEDYFTLIDTLAEEFSFITPEDALVFMGHGSSHYSNSSYPSIDYMFKAKGYNNVHIGTVEGYPTIDEVIKSLEISKPKKVYLSPLMIVAGDHATNDMAGDDEDSWKNILLKNNYQVECILKGLGEYKAIRELFIKHIEDAI